MRGLKSIGLSSIALVLACGNDTVVAVTETGDTSTTVATETSSGETSASTGDGDGDPTGDGDGDGDTTTSGDGDGDPATGDGDGDGDGTGDGDGDASGDGDGDTSGDGDGDTTGDGDGDMTGDGDGEPAIPIPESCAQALNAESTVGCLFFGADLDSHDAAEDNQFAIAVSNVQLNQVASVTIERKINGNWQVQAGPTDVDPLDLATFNLPASNQDDSGVNVGGAFRITSDTPIIAYQFNPVDGSESFLSDASMLYPVPTWDHINQVVGWRVIDDGFGIQGAYASIVAAEDGTTVTVTPSVNTLAGPGVPAGQAGVPFEIMLDEGDLAEVMTKGLNGSLTGTLIEADEDHPIAVFSGNECTFIPADVFACDHLEEQLAGVRLWGEHFIASRVPPRSNQPDTSLWQIYASEDETTVELTADMAVTGLPGNVLNLDAGEVVEFYVGGTAGQPGDFEVLADKPIAVLNYMTGAQNPGANNTGDPAMVQLSPIEQYLPRYVVLVPGTWETDVAVIAREAGAPIEIDEVPVDDQLFIPVANSGYEVARIPIEDGVHFIDGTFQKFSVVIVGYDAFDSYAYLGGTGTGIINPNPQ